MSPEEVINNAAKAAPIFFHLLQLFMNESVAVFIDKTKVCFHLSWNQTAQIKRNNNLNRQHQIDSEIYVLRGRNLKVMIETTLPLTCNNATFSKHAKRGGWFKN